MGAPFLVWLLSRVSVACAMGSGTSCEGWVPLPAAKPSCCIAGSCTQTHSSLWIVLCCPVLRKWPAKHLKSKGLPPPLLCLNWPWSTPGLEGELLGILRLGPEHLQNKTVWVIIASAAFVGYSVNYQKENRMNEAWLPFFQLLLGARHGATCFLNINKKFSLQPCTGGITILFTSILQRKKPRG